jgi:hypothetical protein
MLRTVKVFHTPGAFLVANPSWQQIVALLAPCGSASRADRSGFGTEHQKASKGNLQIFLALKSAVFGVICLILHNPTYPKIPLLTFVCARASDGLVNSIRRGTKGERPFVR